MENILKKIVLQKKIEVAQSKAARSLEALQQMPLYKRACSEFSKHLLDPKKPGIIAEFKRKSPSKGIINKQSSVKEIVQAYTAGGASAISILTDGPFFGGALADLLEARAYTDLPLLRKDFMIDSYQIYEAKAFGADIILLIAAILTPSEIAEFAELAHQLGLSVLLEVHDEKELMENLDVKVDAIGVNNRNLADFSVDLNHSFSLCNKIPSGVLKISESAISDVKTIEALKQAGFNGFLIGETFMKTEDPGVFFRRFVDAIKI